MSDQSKNAQSDSEAWEALLGLFDIKVKSELKKYCRNLIITRSVLADLILTVTVGGLGSYKYASHFADIVPEHLSPKSEELEALARSGIGTIEGKAAKGVRRLSQLFNERKLFAAHLFYTPDHTYWYLFYFSAGRDTAKLRNHWKHGPHIHLICDLWSQIDMLDAWAQIKSGKINFPTPLHIRYDEERLRRL